jgi:cytoskeletal protein CcmA (bactofilin family)
LILVNNSLTYQPYGCLFYSAMQPPDRLSHSQAAGLPAQRRFTMKRLLGLLCCVVALSAMADEKEQRVERDLGSDHFAAGRTVNVAQPVAGDLIAAGGKVEVNGHVSGDAVLSGGEVRLNSNVAQGLYMAGGRVWVNGNVGRNVRVAGGQVEQGTKSIIDGNLSVGGGKVRLMGQVKGYVQAAGGEVFIDSVVGGDVEARSGQVTLGPNARIIGKLRYASREAIKRDPAAQVTGGVDQIAVAGGWPLPEDVERGMGRSGGWIWTIGLLLVAGVLVAAFPGFYTRVATTWRERFPMSLLLGFVMLVCIPVAAVLFFITIIGVPLGLLTLASYFMLLIVGYVNSGIALGAWAATRWSKAPATGRAWRAGAAMLGVLAVGLLARLPWAGGVVMLVALLAGLGAFGLQAWRSASSNA